MNLSKKVAHEFEASVRSRGVDYYLRRQVQVDAGSSTQAYAHVKGSRQYQTSLEWDDGALYAMCDCPFFVSDGPCKHLWATILAAESHGHLADAAAAPKLDMIFGIDDEDDGDDDYLLDEDDEDVAPPPVQPVILPPPPKPPAWQAQIAGIANVRLQASRSSEVWPAKRELVYIVDVPLAVTTGSLVLSIASHDRKADGTWNRITPIAVRSHQVAQLPVREDREILSLLSGGTQYYGWGYTAATLEVPASCQVAHPLAGKVMPLVARTGRCYLRRSREPDDLIPLAWDEGGTWELGLEMRRKDRQIWEVVGTLRRGEERMDVAAALLVTQGGLVFTGERAAPLAENTPFEWISYLRKAGRIEAPEEEKEALLAGLLCTPGVPALDTPEDLRFEEVVARPRPCLRIPAARPGGPGGGKLRAELWFDYEGRMARASDPAGGYYDAATRRLLRRDPNVETAAAELLGELGLKFRPNTYWDPEPGWELAPTKVPRLVRALLEAGWHLEAEGKIFKRPGAFRIDVSSGVDWFELHGTVQYGSTTAKLPALLEAVRRGDNMVRLDDGAYGMLPDEWLRRIGLVAGMGTPENGHIKFRRSQAGFLDALLAAQPEAGCDETFARVREEMRQFQGVEAAAQPAGFVGQLRDYQREGLGWMEFLRRFSFGGCLADDMGVGKTAQVLALLETRRELRAGSDKTGEKLGPSLVVMPKSLVFNWKQEAQRFTPQVRVLDYTGLTRSSDDFAAYDVVLTTYGTLRRDALRLKDVEFDYVILDEAQAVKNAGTESAKAVRLLRGNHRLALSGTPVENHLGELWALFEFLNPGMLGAASVFKLAGEEGHKPGEETRQMLACALRPFILRRTKEQVARELPAKTEQTMYCEMEPVQRKLYNELKQHYQNVLLHRIDAQGLKKSKIQVLEALLRLRQAACHPGLIDPKRAGEPSAKLDVLLEQIREVLEGGHKALVFSQFTSMLRIVRDRLDANGTVYEYLDGATTNRQRPVERFQNDPNCSLFLISLKAGGLGLNLTAAEYVFLLDPWWNPAVEAQAVDRAHRIGQLRQVFAYRLIARDTVEEKVLELQKTKKDLAAAIIGADNSLIKNLRREDLELLLS
jgi:superfamily II DNA or RNA helicase